MTIHHVETSLSVEKSIIILRQLCKEPFEYRLSDLVKSTNINRTTLYRILNTFEEQGLVIKTQQNKVYKLGPMAYQMGSVYLSSFEFSDKIYPVLKEIAAISKESVGLAVREGDRIISLYEIEIEQPLKMNYRAGILYPMNRGCYGKCLMAYHDQTRVNEMLNEQQFEKVAKHTLTKPEDLLIEYEKIRRNGYVISDEETFPYAVGVGIPIPNSNGEIKTCVAISFIKKGKYNKKIDELLELLLQHKSEIIKYMV